MGKSSEPEEKETWVIKDIISDGALSLLLKHTTLYSAVFALRGIHVYYLWIDNETPFSKTPYSN